MAFVDGTRNTPPYHKFPAERLSLKGYRIPWDSATARFVHLKFYHRPKYQDC